VFGTDGAATGFMGSPVIGASSFKVKMYNAFKNIEGTY